MIACIIEFGVRPGAEQQRDYWVAELMKSVIDVEGFVSKETFVSRDQGGKLITLSYWQSPESLQNWVNHPTHVRAVAVGKRSVFSYFRIEVSDVSRTIDWKYEPADDRLPGPA